MVSQQETIGALGPTGIVMLLLVALGGAQRATIAIATFVNLILLMHIVEGVESVICDYVHNEKTKRICVILLKCVQIESLKYLYLFVLGPLLF